MNHVAWINGKWVSTDSPQVSLLSSGLAHGFGLFETIAFRHFQPCFFAEHLARIRASANLLELGQSLDTEPWLQRCLELLQRNQAEEGLLKLLVFKDGNSMGTALFIREVRARPTTPPSFRLCESPVVRSSNAFTSHHKTLNYLDALLELRKARQHGFDEALQCNEFGQLTECTVSNLFLVKNRTLHTPATTCGLLPGVIRGKILEMASQLGLSVEEGLYKKKDLYEAQEVFLTNSNWLVAEVKSLQTLDGQEFRYNANEHFQRLWEEIGKVELESLRT